MAALLLLQAETWTISVIKRHQNLKQTNKKIKQVSVPNVNSNPLGLKWGAEMPIIK